MNYLKLKDAKSLIESNVNEHLKNYSFKHKKSTNTFYKKTDEGFIEITFIYHNYFPINYDVSFVISIRINAVEELSVKFWNNMTSGYEHTSCSIFISENELTNCAKIIQEGEIWKNSNLHEFVDESSALDVSRKMLNTILKDGLPLIEKINNIRGMNKYLNDPPNLKHLKDYSSIYTNLACSYLCHDSNFNELVETYTCIFKSEPVEKRNILLSKYYNIVEAIRSVSNIPGL